MEQDKSGAGHGTCGAKTRNGGACGKPAGWGTPHTVGRCRLHGGSTRNHRKAAQRLEAERAVAAFGLPRNVDPGAALLEELHRTAGWVGWLTERVQEEGPDALAAVAYEDEGAVSVTSPFYDLLDRERKQLVAVAAACIKAGVEERRLQMIEQSAAFAARAIRTALGNLGLDIDAPEIREAVTSALSVVPDPATESVAV